MNKPLLFMALLLLCSMPAMAQWVPTSNLTIFSEDGAKFFLVLNGERYNDEPATNVRIEELPNPYYNCKVIFEDSSIPPLSKSALMLADVDGIMQDVTYRIKNNKGKRSLRFYSSIPAEQNMPRPANCAVYRYGQPHTMVVAQSGPSFTETVTVQQTVGESVGMNMNVGGMGVSVNMPVVSGTMTTTTTTTTTTNGGGGVVYEEAYSDPRPHGGGGRPCRYAMGNADFEEARAAIKNNGFDETRLSTAKQIMASNCLTVNQVVAILKEFSFEETKLDFAKFAYNYCTERNNYFKVSNVFAFESSKIELNEYIQGQR